MHCWHIEWWRNVSQVRIICVEHKENKCPDNLAGDYQLQSATWSVTSFCYQTIKWYCYTDKTVRNISQTPPNWKKSAKVAWRVTILKCPEGTRAALILIVYCPETLVFNALTAVGGHAGELSGHWQDSFTSYPIGKLYFPSSLLKISGLLIKVYPGVLSSNNILNWGIWSFPHWQFSPFYSDNRCTLLPLVRVPILTFLGNYETKPAFRKTRTVSACKNKTKTSIWGHEVKKISLKTKIQTS
jgi:hypothetical protein